MCDYNDVESAATSKCKRGGCSAIGCEGGHYCFNADGSPKVVTPDHIAELEAAYKEN